MFSTTFYPASFQPEQPPSFGGGGLHYPPHPPHFPPRGHPFGASFFACASPREGFPPGGGGSFPSPPSHPGFGFAYGLVAPPPSPPPPVFGMHSHPWVSPLLPPFSHHPTSADCREYQHGPYSGFHSMRPPPFSLTRGCACCVSQNNSSEQFGEYCGASHPARDGTSFPPPQPPTPQACDGPSLAAPGDNEELLPAPLKVGHQNEECDKPCQEREVEDPESREDLKGQDTSQTPPALHRDSHCTHRERHAHSLPPHGRFHGPHATLSDRHPAGRRRPFGSHPFGGFGHHPPPMPPPHHFGGQPHQHPPFNFGAHHQRASHHPCCATQNHDNALLSSRFSHGRSYPCCVGPPPTGQSGPFTRPHGPPPNSGPDPNAEDRDEQVELPITEADRICSNQIGERKEDLEGIEYHERAQDVVSEVAVGDGKAGGHQEGEVGNA